MDTAASTAIATVIAAVIAGLVGIATQRSAAKAAVLNQTTASRTEIEKEAFERAKSFYTGSLERADADIKRQDDEIHELRGEVDALRAKVRLLEEQVHEQADTIARRDAEIRTLAAVIAAKAEQDGESE